jgi:general secretion pathway protein D
MNNKNNKSGSALLAITMALLMGCLSSAAWVPQEPGRPATTEEERKRALDRLTRRGQENQPAAKQPSGMPAPQAQPTAPATTGVPVTPNVPNVPAMVTPQNPAIPPVASTVQRESGKVVLNMENADLYDFINQIASTLGISPLIVDSDVKGNVNIISSGSLSKDDVLPIFNLILKNNNAALVKQGDIYQIVPISSALKRGLEIIEHLPPTPADKTDSEKAPENKLPDAKPKMSSSATPAPPISGGGPFQSVIRRMPTSPQPQATEPASSTAPKLSTHVIRVEFVPVKDLIEPIKQLMTEGGVIMPYERLNMLILTDYSDSISRILEIIHMLDSNYLDPDLIDLVKIKYNASADVADDLRKIFGTGTKEAATGIYFNSIDRLNAIFVMASSKRGLEEIRRWIKELDAESGRNIQTYVYVVENSTASNIALMLSALYGGEGSVSSVPGGTGGAEGGGTSGGIRNRQGQSSPFGSSSSNVGGSNQIGSNQSFNQSYNQGGNQSYNSGQYGGGYMGGSSFGGGGQRLGPQLNTSRSVTSQVLRGGEFSGLQDTVRLVVDDVNNSLYIQATAADYAYILDTIKKMDVLPRQAIIDARIFEVQLTNDFSFGVNAILQPLTDGSKGEHSTGGDIGVTTGGISANTFAFVGNTKQIIGALNALRNKTKVKILEAPSVLALDGMQASINVGSEIPYPSGSYTPSAGGSTTSIQYRETGVTLLVLPRISASGSVTMDITQEVSDQGSPVDIGANEKATSFKKSLVQTSFTVKDGETVAIAGLITDSDSWSRNGVPFLADIPILGSLFGKTSKNVNRVEQIILITPHVIKTPDKLAETTQDLKDSLRNVRKYVDEKDQERMEDLQDARKDREKQGRKELKNTKASEPKK